MRRIVAVGGLGIALALVFLVIASRRGDAQPSPTRPHTVNPVRPALSAAAVGAGAADPNCRPGDPHYLDPALWAFADNVCTKFPGGRAGDLDESRWALARTTQDNNPPLLINPISPVNRQFCLVQQFAKLPPDDSFICGAGMFTPDGTEEFNHWMSAINDNGKYVTLSARIRQPFDFAAGDGRVVGHWTAETGGAHSWWTELWITDSPAPVPHLGTPGINSPPPNGIGIVLDFDCGNPRNQVGVGKIALYRGGGETIYDTQGPGGTREACLPTPGDPGHNHFELRISPGGLELWANSQAGQPLIRISSLAVPMPLVRGFVHFQHSHYDASKEEPVGTFSPHHTVHWHNIAFNGPVLPIPRAYEAWDKAEVLGDGRMVTGYGLGGGRTATWALANVDITGATAARLVLSTVRFAENIQLQMRWNGDAATSHAVPQLDNWGRWTGLVIPVPLSRLRAGANTLEFSATADVGVVNVDLEVEVQPSVPTPTPTTSPSPTVTVTSSPTSTPTASPSPTPTATATGTPTMQPTAQPTPTGTPTLTPTPRRIRCEGPVDDPAAWECVWVNGLAVWVRR